MSQWSTAFGRKLLLVLTTDDLWHSPGFLIRRCQQITTAIFLEEASAYDFSPTQYSALAFIVMQPGVDQSTLGDCTALDRSSVTKCVERLEQRNFIKREICQADRRARRLYPTTEGEAMLVDLAAAADRARCRILAPLKPEERDTFLSTLQHLGDALNDQSRAPMQATSRLEDATAG
ncbi:MAG: MarR family winged helix-turn-helix transcriptional regulator [Neorhizobium sp.]|nr:MarR family winged helix-turn-helix transcriptional regulator [Neorhizobium sp.]